MKALIKTVAFGACCALAVACSDDDVKVDSADDAAVDTTQVDTVSPDSALPHNMGEGCSSKTDCEPGSPLCIMFDTKNKKGVCSMECSPDDPDTPFDDEDNCPDGFLCSEFRFGGTSFSYCLKECEPSLTANPCPASSQQTCHPTSMRFTSGGQAVCWFAACESDDDCPVRTEHTCTNDDDCDEGTIGAGVFCDGDSGRCALPGNCTAAGLCGPHDKGSGAVGDPCDSDLECPGTGQCFFEQSFAVGSIGTAYRNGYCISQYCLFAEDPASELTEYACPQGSVCNRLFYGGVCHKTCVPADASTCRDHEDIDMGGDYDCYDWGLFRVISIDKPVADAPICQNASTETCNGFGADSDCTSIAPQGNPHNMACRDRRTGAIKEDIKDPTGVCLDDTPSGPFEQPQTDGGPDADVDAGPDGQVDAGPDGQVDVGPDGQVDMGVDLAAELGLDMAADSSVEAGGDSALPDTGPDTAAEAGGDVS